MDDLFLKYYKKKFDSKIFSDIIKIDEKLITIIKEFRDNNNYNFNSNFNVITENVITKLFERLENYYHIIEFIDEDRAREIIKIFNGNYVKIV